MNPNTVAIANMDRVNTILFLTSFTNGENFSIILSKSEVWMGLIFSTVTLFYTQNNITYIYKFECRYQTHSDFLSVSVSLEAFLNSLTASAIPLKSSGIFLPPKSKTTTAAIISSSVVPIDGI